MRQPRGSRGLGAAIDASPRSRTAAGLIRAIRCGQLPAVAASESEVVAARENFSTGLEEIENWYRSTVGIKRPFEAVGVQQPFYLAYQPFNNLALLTRYGDLCALWMATFPAPVRLPGGAGANAAPVSAPGRKLRIGFVSAHICEHSVWNAITKGWVQHLDRRQFDIWLFQLGRTHDEETSLAKSQVAHFEDRPTTLQGWVEAIRAAMTDE